MDIQATAQLLGNFGEFFGAIAVVATLAYLAVQIRQNTNALRSASYEHWNQQAAEFAHFQGQHAKELAETEDVASFDELTGEQFRYVACLLTIASNQAQCAFLQHRAGTVDDDVFEARIRAFLFFIEKIPHLKETWGQITRESEVPAFVEYIEERASWLRPATA
jgi:hypothetical protein